MPKFYLELLKHFPNPFRESQIL